METSSVPAMLIAVRVTLLAVVAGLVFSVLTPAAAEGAERKPFRKPTTFTPLQTTCTEYENNHFRITTRWRVTGGRYANLGNPANGEPTYNDVVWSGGARIILASSTSHGWYVNSEGHGLPMTMNSQFQQYVAPIGKHHDMRTWRLIQRTAEVTVTC